MTPRINWLCEYEKFNSGNVLLGDYLPTIIFGRGKVRLKLKDGRTGTLLGVLHIPSLVINLIYVSKMGNAGVQAIFEKDSCNMVRGVVVLMGGVR